jgi:hypothetical protein
VRFRGEVRVAADVSRRLINPVRMQQARRFTSAATGPMLPRGIWITLALSATIVSSGLEADDIAIKIAEKPPPQEVDANVRARLENRAVQLVSGGSPVYEFWFAKEVPLQGKPASNDKSLDAVKQPALLGVVSVPKSMRDYRDDELAAGVYTLRLGLQPQDGNHLGTSDYPWFAVLVPAKRDTRPDGITDYKSLVKASSQGTATDHPGILSLRPAAAADGTFPALSEPAPNHKSMRIKLPGKTAAGDAADLIFELVYQGMGKK